MTRTELLAIIDQAAREEWAELNLRNKGIAELPEQIWQLANLTSLDLGDNQLTAVPEQIGQLTNLKRLDLCQNQLTELPIDILLLAQARPFYVQSRDQGQSFEFYVNDNGIWIDDDLRFPPPEILSLGSEAIVRFLTAARQQSSYQWESKCLFVGEGGVGKTCLYNVLNGRPCQENEEGTVGIEIGPLTLPHPEKEDVTIQLNCWDFAGQDFNHAMHQFFFSNRALFLLVWNARHGWQQGKLYRWLENIKVRAPQAKIILVATHTDQPHSDYPAAELQTRYPQIVETIEVSNTTGDNIPQLRRLIQQQAATLPLMGLRWPHTWLEAANAVRSLGQTQPHASRLDIVALMQAHGLNGEECDILMRWLHELGDILYFADDPLMRGRITLDPQWLTRHIGLVLRSDEVARQQGILRRSHLQTLWPTLDDYLQDHILRLMDKFDLAYLIPEDPKDPEDRSLIVERLPLDPPDYAPLWAEFADRGSQISLRFKLDSMQPGIPTWFIARCHRFTTNTHWLNGVLFKDEADRHRALITAEDRKNVIQMSVRGPFPQRFMSLLRDGFRDTLKRYEGLQIERLVPCPGYNELEERPCDNEFKLDSLETWLEKRPDRIFFSCPECDTQLSRLQLVEGIGAAALTEPLTTQRMSELLDQAHDQTRQEIKDHLDKGIEDLLKYQQRNFLRIYKREQQRELIACPNLFTIRQVSGRGGVIKKQEWQIQLYCQHPGNWHPVGEPYVISEQREWFKKSLPYLKGLLKVLRVVTPLAGAALAAVDVAGDKSQWARSQHDIFENEVKLMADFLKGAEAMVELDQATGEQVRDLPHRATFAPHEGAGIVMIRELMDQLAEIDKEKGRLKWAGLTHRQTPEGDIFWLDQEHLQEYLQNVRPPIQ